jgi:hypothetical protein
MSKIELPPLLLDFSIEPETPTLPRILTWSGDRGRRPATSAECELWDAIRARDRQIVEVCAARVANALASKPDAAKRGHRGAASAFVTYDGAAADLNELARYVDRLEIAIRNLIEESNNG